MSAMFSSSNRKIVRVSDHFLKYEQVREVIPVSKVTLRHWIRAGKFPKPIKLFTGSVVWRRSDIDNWFNSQTDEPETVSKLDAAVKIAREARARKRADASKG